MENKNEENEVLNVGLDDIMRYKQIPYKSGDVVLLDEQDVMKHSFNPPVQIDAAVLVLCTDGMMEIEVFRGDLLVCGPNRVMKPIKLLNNTAFKIIFLSHFIHRSGIGYQRSIWDKAFYLGTNPMIHLSDTQITQFEEYYRLLCEKLKNPSSSYHSEIMQSILQAMMYEILSYLDGVVVSENDRFVRQGEILFRRFVGKCRLILAKWVFEIVVQRFYRVVAGRGGLLFYGYEVDIHKITLLERGKDLVLALRIVKTQKSALKYGYTLEGELLKAAHVNDYLGLFRYTVFGAEDRDETAEHGLIYLHLLFREMLLFGNLIGRCESRVTLYL